MNARNRMKDVLTLAIVAVAFVGLAATSADAQPIPVVNAGFEDPPYPDGEYGIATGWDEGYYDLTDPTTWVEDASLWYGGGWDPDAASGGWGGVAPEGENTGWTTSYIGFEGGLRQILTATLQADTVYELSVLVGNPVVWNEGPAPDYRIELLAGDVLLTSATGPSPVDDTTWLTASLTFNPGASHAQLGQPLEIRLLAVEYVGDEYEVDYDVVTLSSETPPTAPTNLTANPTREAVLLDWDPVPDVAGYNIYYGETQGGPYTSNTTAGAVASYMVTGLQNDTTYYFVLAGFNAAGEGPRSNEASATPRADISLGVRRWEAYR